MNHWLGCRVKDAITGFEGIVTGITIWVNGCERVCVERADKDGKPEEAWFDVQRVDVVAPAVFVPRETRATAGGPRNDPPRFS